MSNESKNLVNIQNQTSNSSSESSVIHKNQHVSPIGRVLAAVEKVKEEQAKTSKASEDLIGFVLMTSPPLTLSVQSFQSIYSEKTSFYKSVIQKDGKKINPKKDGSIIRAYCYVPEISGCLPFPDIKKLHKFLTLWNESERPAIVGDGASELQEKYDAEREKNIKKMYPDLYKEFQKVVMHPIFYKYVEGTTSIAPLQFVTVKYTGDFDTYHTGVISDIHGDYVAIDEIATS